VTNRNCNYLNSVILLPVILVVCIPGALFLGTKLPGREADHLPPASAEVRE